MSKKYWSLQCFGSRPLYICCWSGSGSAFSCQCNIGRCSVSDHFVADPDPNPPFRLDVDPEPTFHFCSGSGSCPSSMWYYLLTWVTWLEVSSTPGRGVVDTTVDDVVATVETCMIVFDWHSTCMSEFAYTRFALRFSVINWPPGAGSIP